MHAQIRELLQLTSTASHVRLGSTSAPSESHCRHNSGAVGGEEHRPHPRALRRLVAQLERLQIDELHAPVVAARGDQELARVELRVTALVRGKL